MSYKIIALNNFMREAKRLNNKYPSFKKDFARLEEELINNPVLGIPLGNNCFKIRLAITSKGKGKSGGSRVVTHVKVLNEKIYLLTVYDKSEQEDLPDKKLEELLKKLPE